MNKNKSYHFLHERLTREPYITEVLSEVDNMQSRWVKHRSGDLATLEYLNDSRNIRIPFTPKRMLNIEYIIEELIKYHPEEVKPVYSFSFEIDQESKNLSINEKTEITLQMKENDFNFLFTDREKKSQDALIDLLSKYRLFNLTKLIKKSKKRNQLSQLVKTKLGKDVFTFKNYSLDKNGFEINEDYCFHSSNYEHVKKKIDIEMIKNIVDAHSAAINRRLKSFGILNTYISDYRDSKLDYIMNILTGEMSPAFDKKEIISIKNFKSLRDCLIKVDKLLDPVKLLDNDIMKYIQSQFIATDKDILNIFEKVTPEIFTRWELEAAESGKIIIYTGQDSIKYLIDSTLYPKKFNEIIQLIVYNPDAFMSLYESDQDNKIFTAEILSEAGKKITSREGNALKLLKSQENIAKVNELIKDFEFYKMSRAAENSSSYNEGREEDSSIFSAIINLFKSIFSRDSKAESGRGQAGRKDGGTGVSRQGKKEISKTARDLYRQIQSKPSPLAALSDLIEIKPENEKMIDQLIAEIRSTNLKIVIPIFNARQVLYPVRSKKYLIADVEYLMVDPEIPRSPEAIRDFTDSITGFSLKDDVISGNALFQIEKYLMTIYRQNRAKMKRKKK